MTTQLSSKPLGAAPSSNDRLANIPLGTPEGQNTFDDIIDSPLWETYPDPGVPTGWSIQDGVYTMEGPSVPDQVIGYSTFEFKEGEASATVVGQFSTNIQTDIFLAIRVVNNLNWLGVRINQNGLIFSECIAGSINNLTSIPVG